MTAICTRLRDFLDRERIPYQALHHTPDFTAQETAAHTRTPGLEFAKVVVVKVDGRHAMAVLPAHHRVDLRKLGAALGAKVIELCAEHELRALFDDCELGAEPPFGHLYGMPVYMSPATAEQRFITFNGGSHEDVIRIPVVDYVLYARPRIVDLSVP
jgi:Ala-tRNA(Pro) deacylase